MHFYEPFYVKWLKYEQELSQKGVKNMAKDISDSEESMLTNDQRAALKKLKEGLQQGKK